MAPSSHHGQINAGTAALHFDEGVFAQLDAMGVQRAHVTLHVGAGTFQPVKTENLAEHQMHSEWYEVPAETQAAIAVEIVGDTVREGNENFYLDVFNPVGAIFGPDIVKLTAVRTILDDDVALG